MVYTDHRYTKPRLTPTTVYTKTRFTPTTVYTRPQLTPTTAYTKPLGVDISRLPPLATDTSIQTPSLRLEVDANPNHQINELRLGCTPPLRPCSKFCCGECDWVPLLVFGESVSTVAAFVRALWFHPPCTI